MMMMVGMEVVEMIISLRGMFEHCIFNLRRGVLGWEVSLHGKPFHMEGLGVTSTRLYECKDIQKE